MVSREWCQCKPKPCWFTGEISFQWESFESPTHGSHAQETNTFACKLKRCLELHMLSIYPTCFLLTWLGHMLCFGINCLLNNPPRSWHILSSYPKFDIPNSSIYLLSPVNCASIFVSVFNCFCECYVLETQGLCPPKFIGWNLLPHVIIFQGGAVGRRLGHERETTWMGLVLL